MQSSTRRVLVVDDEEIVRVLLQHVLGAYHVELVGSVAEALRRLACQSFDAVVTDKSFPDGDGADICREARRGNPNVALIVVTGYLSTPATEEFSALDIDGCVAKPFDVECLTQVLQSAIERRATDCRRRLLS